MKRVRRGYCSGCSTEKEDERDLEIINKTIRCLNCRLEQMFVPENEYSPFHYLISLEEIDGRRI